MKTQTFIEGLNKDKIKKETKEILKRIGELQYKMYAEGKQSLLIIFQGLDAAGKDGLTSGLLRYCNPTGFSVASFKKPTSEEYTHDFLWRIHKQTPKKGELKIFIRSHYEDILVPAVEKTYSKKIVEARYQLINDFERLILHNDTKILKFFLSVSPKTQEERLNDRINIKEKHWKHNDGDWDTRQKMDKYLDIYNTIMNRCNEIPWHIIPADTNWQKLYYVAQKVLKTLEDMDCKWPELKSELFK